jgi:hypothetical protein
LRGLRLHVDPQALGRLGFGRRDVPDRPERAAVVEPVDPFEGRELDGVQAAPGSARSDDLGLEQPDRGLGERVVATVADRPDGGLDACFARRSA